MKKPIALLLAICLIAGLTACSKETENSENATMNTAQTTPSATVNTAETVAQIPDTEGTETLGDDETTASDPTMDEEQAPTTTPSSTPSTVETTVATKTTEATKPNPSKSPYNGKTLEIYGLGTESSYTDYSQYTKEYQWMMRAAIVEWAEINGVKLIFSGEYDQNDMLSAMSGGASPDVVFHTDKFPANANVNIIASFTDAEYKKLAKICGADYLDMLKHKTQSYGFVLPWASNTMCYYNKTLFDKHNVKTPKEYFMEDDWTWTNFQKCMEEINRDVDKDGKIDIYGMPGDSLAQCRMVNPYKTNVYGELVNTIDEPIIQAYFQFKYDVFKVSKCVIPSPNNIQTNTAFPMFAMQLSDCESYNFEQLYQTISNGDQLEVVPVPAYDGKSQLQWKQACVSLASTCDERAAAVDMLAYLLKCGMRYVSDYSLGVIPCDYAGVQGFSTLSSEFVKAFAELCKSRADAIARIDNYDEAFITKVYESGQNAEWYTYQTLTGVTLLTSYGEITQFPVESAIPKIKPKYEAEIQKYNELYIKES